MNTSKKTASRQPIQIGGYYHVDVQWTRPRKKVNVFVQVNRAAYDDRPGLFHVTEVFSGTTWVVKGADLVPESDKMRASREEAQAQEAERKQGTR